MPDAPGGAVVHPLTPERWADLEALFGERGAVAGCWCMWWRLTRAEWSERAGEGNRRALRAIAEEGRVPGLLAYLDGRPVGWCSVAPRAEFPALDRSPVLRRVDATAVWSIVCFYIDRRARRRGVMDLLIRAAAEHAARNGARVVEAYPVDPVGPGKLGTGSAFTGFAAAFRRAGFVEVERRSPARPIMRLEVGGGPPGVGENREGL